MWHDLIKCATSSLITAQVITEVFVTPAADRITVCIHSKVNIMLIVATTRKL